jgi:mono/diheme cytochrome c family protein
MKKWPRRILLGGTALVALGVAAGVTVYAMSESRFGRLYDVAGMQLRVSGDPAQVERGRHLATALAKCTDCHGADLGGTVMMEDGAMGVLAASNLTAGRGGVLSRYDDRQLEAAIRHGVAPDGRALLLMPSAEYQHMSDEDVAAVIAYLRTVPPVDRELPAPKAGPIARALLVTGKMPLLSAELIDHRAAAPAVAAAGVTAEYGHYLAQVGGCFSCHGPALTGGITHGPPGSPPSTNITPAGIGAWSEADWFAAMRTGKRPDGRDIADAMPWRAMARMTDDELRALWLYLRTVPAAETPAG